MDYSLFHVDAFTDTLFRGNPACVVPLENWLEDAVLLSIAKENAVPETAFFEQNEDQIHLRWFTPDLEMDLCGHATLATAHVLKKHLGYDKKVISFTTMSGIVSVSLSDELYYLDFPSRMPLETHLPKTLEKALNAKPKSVLKARDYVLVYDREEEIQNIQIKRTYFDELDLGTGGVIVTAPGENVDFVSRFFTPRATLLEDPVTGSAHCSLIPYWASVFSKQEMTAQQISERGGQLFCKNQGDRVLIGGKARTFSKGTFQVR
ncbi:MAG: PhzF family phenazine biosynthesis protein [Flavobacteriaceae bacterium]|jgi:PhzF family phenazine biosynthesis protein|nr:PhzF family phenazine biosynthesis protein [Flavobacteriaceae bacterium]MDG1920583.1 PhzF family phenazine biosynthesis protein [Flavobacteriaceae bacterium]